MNKLLLMVSIFFAGSASASVITFDAVPTGSFTSITTDGFDLDRLGGVVTYVSSGGTSFCFPSCADNGTNHIMSIASTVVLSRSDDAAFDFLGFDGGETHSGASSTWSTEIRLTGTRSDNSFITESFFLDFINDGVGPFADFQSFVPVSDFSNIVSLAFSGWGAANQFDENNFTFDNLIIGDISSVPEPFSLTLLGLSLAGIGLLRRKSVN